MTEELKQLREALRRVKHEAASLADTQVIALEALAQRPAAQAGEVELAFDQGWRMAAEWANRDDLIPDMDSPHYAKERSDRLASLPTQPAAQEMPDAVEHYGTVDDLPAAQATPDHVPGVGKMMQVTPEPRVRLTADITDPAVQARLAEKFGDVQATPEPKPFAAPGCWFPVDVLGNPMREFEPGKWEAASWPSAATPEPVGDVVWIQPNHLQKARVAPHLCRIAPSRIAPDFVPLTRPAPGVPELTDAMLIAGLKECEPLGELIDWREGFGRDEMRDVWDAMLAAAQAKGGQ